MRTIKPEAFTSETMAGIPVVARWTFAGLWTHCDDEGRCVDNPRLIKAAVYPLDDDISWVDVDDHLGQLVQHGMIERYCVDGQRLISIRHWDRHQHPNKPKPSTLPAPEPEEPTLPGLDIAVPGQGAGTPAARTANGQGTAVVVVGDVVGEGGVPRTGKGGRGTSTQRPTTLPDDFTLTDGSRDFATKRGMTPDEGRYQFQKFKDHHQARGSRFVDWQAAWRTWVGNWGKWEAERAEAAQPAPAGSRRWGDTSV